MTKHLEGRWLLTDVLLNDGSHAYPNEIYEFAKGEPGGDSYAVWKKYSSDFSDTITGTYRVSKNGGNLYFRYDVQPAEEEDATVDDFDKNTLIIRMDNGVHYFEKQ